MSSNRATSARQGWRPAPRRWLLCATLILLIASAFRLVLLAEVPPGLAQDEVLDADIAAFIRGGEHALFFSHGYGHEPLYHYWAAPFQVLFGDNILSIRLPSVYLGLLLVALTMRWARRDYGSLAALAAGAGLAISWWPIIFSRIGIRPILEPVFLVLAAWFWPLGARVLTRRHLASAALAGLWLGLSIYTYTAARIILLIPALMLIVLAGQYLWARRRRANQADLRTGLQAQLAYAALVLLAGAIIYLPLALTLRANPELQQRVEQLEGPLTSLREGDYKPVLQMAAATAGVFSFTGDPRWTYSIPHRPLFDPLTAVLFYGGLVLALWRWRRPAYLLLPIWLVIALLPSALTPDAPSTVRLIGALPVVYLLPGLSIEAGFRWLLSKDVTIAGGKRQLTLLVAGALVFLLLANGFRTVRDGFIRWPRELETRLRYQTVLRDIGRHWRSTDETLPPVVAEIFFEPIDRDSLRRSIGADPEARWVQTGAGVAGALVWPQGEAANLYVPEYAPLEEGLLALGGIDREPLYRSGSSPSFAVYKIPALSLDNAFSQEFSFGESEDAALIGITQPEINGDRLQLGSWWRVGENLPADLAVFIHLVDSSGNVITQFDGLDAAPSTLQPGDVILQRHELLLPESIAPGEYLMRLGLYRRDSGERLLMSNGSDSIEIAACKLESNDLSALDCRLTGFD